MLTLIHSRGLTFIEGRLYCTLREQLDLPLPIATLLSKLTFKYIWTNDLSIN